MKKTPKKKAKKKKKAVHPDVHPEKYFLLIDGSVIKDLESLADAFDSMSDDVFFYHVNEFKNDFETWVRDVVEEKELAEMLRLTKNVEQAQIAVLRHVIKRLKHLI